jgi:ABC-type uncharacterized transport system permease subunit
LQHNAGFNFSFFSTASLISMIVALVLVLAAIRLPVEKLGIFLLPVTALMLGLELYFPERQRSLESHSWQMHTHILMSIIAFSLLNIAAVQAILLVIQNQQLRSHPPKRYIQSLPPLESMESLLFQMIGAGLFFLSISLASGFIFLEDIFAQHLAHKTFPVYCLAAYATAGEDGRPSNGLYLGFCSCCWLILAVSWYWNLSYTVSPVVRD